MASSYFRQGDLLSFACPKERKQRKGPPLERYLKKSVSFCDRTFSSFCSTKKDYSEKK
ncbi:hypothetical protein HMPREF9996_02120 [Aggregatibacter actinomycetemcomitans Y4]|nr:hypothetical protein HMPREF9996_02120 [Aggregatibacter actinomycetemcomitans Y4]